MADLDARTDSFITLLLDVSGRARPSDLQGFSPAEASEMLHRYLVTHPERGLAFDGDTLMPAATAQAAAAVAAPVPPAAADDGMFEFGPAPTPAAPVTVSAPADVTPLAPETGTLVPPAAVGVPVADAAQPAAPIPGPPPAAPSDFVELPPLEGAAEASQQRQPVPIYWWLLAVFFGLLGGLIGWLVLRHSNPQGAKTVLLVGIVVTVLTIVLMVAAFFLGAAAFLGLATTG